MIKAKTKRSLIKILCAIIGVVFAFSIGYTFATADYNSKTASNPNSTATYIGRQEYALNKNTQTVSFGAGANIVDMFMHYSYSYNFDVRIKYSLTWSNGKIKDNVILSFANRDNYIVDNDYIFVRDTINAGDGKLPIITGVDFVDTTDTNYTGATLTIKIEQVKITKQTNYDTNNALVSDIKTGNTITSTAGDAWLKYKRTIKKAEGGNITDNYIEANKALVMMYNYRYSTDFGASFPSDTATQTLDGQPRNVYGNKYRASVGAYVITGAGAVKLKVKTTGQWMNTGDPSEVSQFDNSIRFNYQEDWTYNGTNSYASQSYNANPEYTYTLVIPANSGVYIDIVDSIEVISVGISNSASSNIKAIISSISLNDTPFEGAKLTTKEISTITNNSVTTEYQQPSVEIENASKYVNNLYEDVSTPREQTFDSVVLIKNNTNKVQTYSIGNYTIKYNASNGNTTLTVPTEVVGFNSAYWYKDVGSDETSSITSTISGNTVTLQPYQTKQLISSYSVGANFDATISNKYCKNGITTQEVWVEVVANVTRVSEADDTSSGVSLHAQGTANAYVYNNTNKSYYIRFTGSTKGSSTDMVVVGGNSYYVGILRPNQIIKLPNVNGTLQTIEVTSTEFDKNTFTWTDVVSEFENYFKVK